jgi:SlyX protein
VNERDGQMRSDIETLQVKLAYQEDTIEQLNAIVTEQQGQIQQLEKLTRSMLEKLKSLQSQENTINDGVELPPHY